MRRRCWGRCPSGEQASNARLDRGPEFFFGDQVLDQAEIRIDRDLTFRDFDGSSNRVAQEAELRVDGESHQRYLPRLLSIDELDGPECKTSERVIDRPVDRRDCFLLRLMMRDGDAHTRSVVRSPWSRLNKPLIA